MKNKEYLIVEFKNRFAIGDKNGKIINDAQGYGFKSKHAAHKAAWYLFGGGRKQINKEKDIVRHLKKEYPKLASFIEDFYAMHCKSVYRKEYTEQELDDLLFCEVKEEFGIDLPKFFLKYI